MITTRAFSPKDTAAILAIYAPFILHSNITFDTDMPSYEEFEKKLLRIAASYPFLVALENETVVAYAYANAYRERKAYQWSVETSVYVQEDCKSRGIATSLYHALFQELLRLHYTKAYAIITMPNLASEKFHTKMGFKKIAVFEEAGFKMGEWHDVLWMEKRLQEKGTIPKEPLKWQGTL
jgi:phosphinothricin acetyltransferase